MEKSLSELIQLSRTLGMDTRLVWKGGGNISMKTADGRMLIKASGTELGKMSKTQGWRQVDITKVLKLLHRLLRSKLSVQLIAEGLADCCCDNLDSTQSPSIETFFHALLGCCVVHLHPVYVLPYLCSIAGRQRLEKILKDYNFHWIPFRGLGVVTAGQIQKRIKSSKIDMSRPAVFFLENHGLIVSADSPQKAQSMTRRIVQLCQKNLLPLKSPKPAVKRDKSNVPLSWHLCKPLKTPAGRMPQKHWFKGTITPEELTYLGAGILWLEHTDSVTIEKAAAAYYKRTRQMPMAYYVKNRGLFVSVDKTDLTLLKKIFPYYLQIRGWADQMDGLKHPARKYMITEGY